MKTMLPLTMLCMLSGSAIAVNQSDFYANAGGGIYRLESQGFDDTASTMKLLAGYNLNQYVAFEAGYLKLFDAKDTVEGARIKIDGDAWEIGTRLSYPFNNRIAGYGRLGWSFYDLDAKVTAEDLQFRANENNDGLTWAIGGRVNVTPRIAFNGEYARILVNDADADFLSADLSYRFGVR